MGANRYEIRFNDPRLIIMLQERTRNIPEFEIYSGGGHVKLDFEDYEKIIKLINELSLIKDVRESEKYIGLNEYIRFHRSYVKDTTKSYNYDFRITQKNKNENVNYTATIQGIEQIKLVKQSLIKLHDKYLKDKRFDEEIKKKGLPLVEYKGETYEVNRKGVLQLSGLGIKRITDIKGLDKVKYLRYLILNENNIEEIEGLDHLTSLISLNLYKNNIKKIKGLEKLGDLEDLVLGYNPINSLEGLEHFENLTALNLAGTLIPKELFREVGIKNPENAVALLDFIKNKRIDENKGKEIKNSTIEYIIKASSVFEELSFSKIQSKTGIKLHDLEELIEELIFSGQIKAKIRKNAILFIEENPLIDIALATVDVLHDIKDDTELISYYTSYIEDIFDKTEDIEEFLKSHLANEFEKIKYAWKDYKDGKINKKELIKTGIKQIGKKFVKIFINK